MSRRTNRAALVAAVTAAALLLSGCVAGENSGQDEPAAENTATQGGILNIDFATYNPLSLIIKDQGWLEDALAEQEITVNWIQSAGSNKANEGLKAGAIDVGSTAGSAALLARANGSPIKTIGIYSQPEWAAIVVGADSAISAVADLKGKTIAATLGTDPYFFLVQALDANGLSINDVEVVNLQHADGWAALQDGAVDAWAGLDPIMAGAEQAGAKLIYRNIDLNSYGFLNATEAFLEAKPDVAQTVVDAYEKARAWALENPEETAAILAEVAALDQAVANKVIIERTNLEIDPVPGQVQYEVLAQIGPILVSLGNVAKQDDVDAALDSLFDDTFASAADPARIG